jgi:hypothetical protein
VVQLLLQLVATVVHVPTLLLDRVVQVAQILVLLLQGVHLLMVLLQEVAQVLLVLGYLVALQLRRFLQLLHPLRMLLLFLLYTRLQLQPVVLNLLPLLTLYYQLLLQPKPQLLLLPQRLLQRIATLLPRLLLDVG